MNTENKNTIELNGKILQVEEKLFDFAIYQKVSSNIDYFGIDYVGERLFVQFKSGSRSYMFSGIDMNVLDQAKNAESIGRFVSSTIVGKFPNVKFDHRLVTPIQ